MSRFEKKGGGAKQWKFTSEGNKPEKLAAKRVKLLNYKSRWRRIKV